MFFKTNQEGGCAMTNYHDKQLYDSTTRTLVPNPDYIPGCNSNGNLAEVYAAARKIADLSYDFYGSGIKSDVWLDDRRNESVNPYYSQTTGGLFLELLYGIPGKIWTPWGYWGCWGSGAGTYETLDRAMKGFLAAIGEVRLYQAERNTFSGTVGPIYQILRVGDVVLPEPVARESNSYMEYDEAKKQWELLTHEYKLNKSKI